MINLQVLDLRNNEMNNKGGIEIVNLVNSHLIKLIKLELDENCFTQKGIEEIKLKLDKRKAILGSLEKNDFDAEENDILSGDEEEEE